MKVSTLYGDSSPVRGKDVYVVGLGPSLSVFPMDFLRGKLCLLLNDAQRYFPDLGPIAFSNHRGFVDSISGSITHSIVKGRLKSDPFPERSDNHVPWEHESFYVFSYRMRPHDVMDHMDDDALFAEPDFYWRGPVAVFACQFLLLAGARSITLVGCDCGQLAGEDYFDPAVDMARRSNSKSPHLREGQRKISHNYVDYASGLLRMRREASARFGVPIVSLSPFFGVEGFEAQYRRIRSECGRPLPPPPTMTREERDKHRSRVQEARMQRLASRARRGSARSRTGRK